MSSATLLFATGDGGTWREALVARAGSDVAVLSPGADPAQLADACASAAGQPLVVVLARGEAAEGWLQRLGSLAGPSVGTVSCLPVAPDVLETAPAASPTTDRPAPTLEAAVGSAVLIAPGAIDLIGGLRGDQHSAADAVLEFSLRAAAAGLVNLLAHDVPFAGRDVLPDSGDEEGPVARAVARVRRRSSGTSVTIDARNLSAPGAGTQVHVLELIGALAGRVPLRVVLPPDPTPWAQGALERLDGVEVRTYDEVNADPRPTDIVHRPFQVYDMADIALLRRIGRRLVVTHQDQLLYRNPSYFRTNEEWINFRRGSRLVLSWADRVVFFSRHSCDEALRDEVVDPEQVAVVPIGTERRVTQEPVSAARPAGDWSRLGDRPFLLVLGTDLAHKNRTFAIRLAGELRASHGWDGGIVLAGPHVEPGSSRDAEDELIADDVVPVLRFDAVADTERRWLVEHCAAVVFASIDEGFGLVPFEAAAAGRACCFAAVGSMAELLPGAEATIAPWDVAESAGRVAGLLDDLQRYERHVAALQAAGRALNWPAAAERLLAVYDEAADAPPRQIVRYSHDAVEREELMTTIHENWLDIRETFGEDGFLLLGREGTVPVEMRRPLLAATARPWSRRPLFAVLRALHRLGRVTSR
jgi:glycosyltransferase involved in cell wall biosynthesis